MANGTPRLSVRSIARVARRLRLESQLRIIRYVSGKNFGRSGCIVENSESEYEDFSSFRSFGVERIVEGSWGSEVRDRAMHIVFRRLAILSTFLSLGLLETFHFAMANQRATYQLLHLQVGWWITLQLLQIAVFCLLALLMSRLIAERRGIAAMFSRLGLLIFLLCYLTHAGVIDIGTGLLVAHADALELAAHVCLGSQSSIVEAIVTYSGNPVGTGLWVLGSLGWMVGALAALLALSTKNDLDAVALNPPILHAKWVE